MKATKETEGKRIVRMVRTGMAQAEVHNLLELSKASGINYKTLCRRMKNGDTFTVGELFLISLVIPLREDAHG